MDPKKALFIAACALGILPAGGGQAQEGSRVDVIVSISNLKTSAGQMRCTMFRTANGFPRKPELAAHRIIGSISGKSATCVFKGIAAGPAAITAFHDENANQKLDMTLGILPKEGLGWSNNPKVTMKPPTFAQSKFLVGNQPTNLQIRLNQR
jgi:uncharacterized protein (DUF2141 family)